VYTRLLFLIKREREEIRLLLYPSPPPLILANRFISALASAAGSGTNQLVQFFLWVDLDWFQCCYLLLRASCCSSQKERDEQRLDKDGRLIYDLEATQAAADSVSIQTKPVYHDFTVGSPTTPCSQSVLCVCSCYALAYSHDRRTTLLSVHVCMSVCHSSFHSCITAVQVCLAIHPTFIHGRKEQWTDR
jgi:hypothetical protein